MRKTNRIFEVQCNFHKTLLFMIDRCRDVSTGATGATEVAPKFSDTLTLSPPGGGQFLSTIAEVASEFSVPLRPCDDNRNSIFQTSEVL